MLTWVGADVDGDGIRAGGERSLLRRLSDSVQSFYNCSDLFYVYYSQMCGMKKRIIEFGESNYLFTFISVEYVLKIRRASRIRPTFRKRLHTCTNHKSFPKISPLVTILYGNSSQTREIPQKKITKFVGKVDFSLLMPNSKSCNCF